MKNETFKSVRNFVASREKREKEELKSYRRLRGEGEEKADFIQIIALRFETLKGFSSHHAARTHWGSCTHVIFRVTET